jgi:hypothetical protein
VTTWSWASDLFTGTDVATLAAHWEAALDTLRQAAPQAPAPAEVALVSMSQGELDHLEADWKD